MDNIVDTGTMQDVTASIDIVKQTATELQTLSSSMRNASDGIGEALKCKYTGMLQDSVTRICRNIDEHVSKIQTKSDNVQKPTLQ